MGITLKKISAILTSVFLICSAHAQNVYNKYGPANGIQKNTGSTYLNSVATSTDVIGLWSGSCTVSSFLRGDGACAIPPVTSPAGTDTQVQFNTTGSFGASADFTWNDSTKTLTLGTTSAATLIGGVTGGGVANQLNILGGNATSGAGGIIQITGGNTTGAAKGGDVNINGGTNTNGAQSRAGGHVFLTGGNGSGSNQGGSITLTSGNGGPSGGGSNGVSLIGGTSNGTGAAGSVTAQGGNASGTGPAGNLQFSGGNNTGGGAAGSLSFSGGTSALAGGIGGNVNFGAGTGGTTNGTITFSAGGAQAAKIDAAQALNLNSALTSIGTTFTLSGCSATPVAGGKIAGSFLSGTTGACTVTITLPTAPAGWSCNASDETAGVQYTQTAHSTTSCTLTATTVSGDTSVFSAMAY
jgi:hypothetical protein